MASLPDYAEADDERERQRRMEQAVQDAVAPVIADLNKYVADAISRRKHIEERWLENVRQYHGLYEPTVAKELGGSELDDESRSKLFINLTRAKTNAWDARLGDMLFPNDEKNWGIDPTPVPELTASAKALVEEAEALEEQTRSLEQANNEAVAASEAGQPVDPSFDSAAMAQKAQELATRAKAARDAAKKAENELTLARERARNMERVIDDQLTESRYPAMCRDVISDLTKLGSGILKGPITRDGARRGWKPMMDGEGNPIENMFELEFRTNQPTYRRVDPWHFFPEPDATCMKEAEWTLERHLPNRKMLRRMAKELGFNVAAVRELLKEGSDARAHSRTEDLGSLVQLRNLEGTSNTSDSQTLRDRYCVWEFHGSLEIEQVAAMIRAMGRYDDADAYEKEADPLESKMVRVFFCGSTLLKIDEIAVLDSGDSLYSVASFEKAEASILGGVGVPHLMKFEQSMLNSAVRMMMDNAALAVAPQIIVDKESVTPMNGRWKLTPRKIWHWVTKAGSVGEKSAPFTAINIPINQDMIAAIINLAMQFIDMTVNLPLIAQGESGEHQTQTKGGLSMLFNSANVVFRRVVKNWDDDITAGVITRAYDWNMQFSNDENIKGDMKCEARGTAVLLVRELQAEQTLGLIREFATHPILGVAFKPYDALKLVLQAMSINPNDVLLDNEAYQQKLKELASQEGPDSPEAIRARAAIEVANIDAQSRRDVTTMQKDIADIRMRTEMMKLATQENLTFAEIEASLRRAFGVEKIRQEGKERQQAAEIGVEREAADRAMAAGALPAPSGGYVSMGATPA